MLGALIGEAVGLGVAAANHLLIASPALMALGAWRGIDIVNSVAKACDNVGALHVCLLLRKDIFEYGGDNEYERIYIYND